MLIYKTEPRECPTLQDTLLVSDIVVNSKIVFQCLVYGERYPPLRRAGIRFKSRLVMLLLPKGRVLDSFLSLRATKKIR